MRRLLSLILVLGFTFTAPAQRRHAVMPSAPLQVPQIEEIAAEALTHVPGVSIAIRKGTAYYAKAWGTLDVATQTPLRTDSQFQIASVSKQFTAAAIMRLVEEGKVRTGDSVRRYIPELDSRFDDITIRHLLNHTSGVADHIGQIDTTFEPKSQAEIIALIMNRPPAFPAGSSWQYSNAGYYLLGVVIERAANMTYEQYLRAAFFEPLQLKETSYCGTTGPLPVGYGRDGVTGAYYPLQPFDMTLVFSAGALCSTASDLVRWNRALTSGIAVSPASFAAMTSETFDAYVGTRYGFGLLIDTFASHRRIWHNGLIYGFESNAAYFPDDDLAIVVLVNYYGLRDRAGEIAEEVERAMLK